MKNWMGLWEVADPSKLADPTKAFTTQVKADIQKQTGMTKDPTKVDPKATLNKAITNAAKTDPISAADALNATTDKKVAQMKKMKKESFQTFRNYVQLHEVADADLHAIMQHDGMERTIMKLLGGGYEIMSVEHDSEGPVATLKKVGYGTRPILLSVPTVRVYSDGDIENPEHPLR